jgi:uncharacterized protein YkwD
MQNFDSTPRLRRLMLLQCGVAAALLAGCGGGGGSGDSATDGTSTSSLPSASTPAASPTPPVTSPAPTPASPAPSPAAPSPAATATCGLPDFVQSALARINQIRANGANCGSSGSFGAAAALTWSAALTQASAAHSLDMATNNYFSHVSLDGRTLRNRVDATGYLWSSLGENIAAGYPTVNAVVDGWVASPGHCANLMNPDFNQFGLACMPGNASSRYSTYWTMDLGRSR